MGQQVQQVQQGAKISYRHSHAHAHPTHYTLPGSLGKCTRAHPPGIGLEEHEQREGECGKGEGGDEDGGMAGDAGCPSRLGVEHVQTHA